MNYQPSKGNLMTTILGVKGWDLSEYAISANAILGIRDSGKTYTGTEAAEELFDAGVPFIAFDPIGVWHSLRIPGKGKGYPVVVAGGRHADLPLTRKDAGAIVRAAMSAGVSLVIDLFSMDLSKADWRSIVRECVEILLHENADHGLRHVFIEEAAEFCPQRVTDGLVFAAVEKLVRMGGNSKLGCTLINQRSADLNKSVLENCANVFVHRQKGKNTLTDLKKWFTLLELSEDEQAKIADSLPNLKSGECWALINDLPKPVFLKVPAKNSLHPDRRAATVQGEAKRQPVPATAFVEQMRARLAPKAKAAAAPVQTSKAVEKAITTDQKTQERAVAAAREAGLAEGRAIGREEGYLVGHHVGAGLYRVAVKWAVDQAENQIKLFRDALLGSIGEADGLCSAQEFAEEGAGFVKIGGEKILRKLKLQSRVPAPFATESEPAPVLSTARAPVAPRITPSVKVASGRDASSLTAPQHKVLASIGFWHSVGQDQPTRAQVGGVAGYSPSSGGFNNLLGQLNSAGLITIPAQGRVALAPGVPYDALDLDGARAKVYSVLSNPERKLVDALVEAGGGPMSRDDLGAATDYSPSSGGFNNLIGGLCTLTIFEKPAPGQVVLSAWAREVLA